MASGSAWWTRTTKARRPVTRRASHIHGWLVAQREVDLRRAAVAAQLPVCASLRLHVLLVIQRSSSRSTMADYKDQPRMTLPPLTQASPHPLPGAVLPTPPPSSD